MTRASQYQKPAPGWRLGPHLAGVAPWHPGQVRRDPLRGWRGRIRFVPSCVIGRGLWRALVGWLLFTRVWPRARGLV